MPFKIKEVVSEDDKEKICCVEWQIFRQKTV